MVNLAVRSAYAGVLQQHCGLLRAWCDETGDDFYGHHYPHPDTPSTVPGGTSIRVHIDPWLTAQKDAD